MGAYKGTGKGNSKRNRRIESAPAATNELAADRPRQSFGGVQSFDGTAKLRGNHQVMNARDKDPPTSNHHTVRATRRLS